MGLPNTLAGITGFLIACMFLLAMSATDIFPDETQNIVRSQEDFTNALNQTTTPTGNSEVGFFGKLLGAVGLDGIYDFIRNFLSLLVNFIVMIIQYLFLFVGIATILPTEFYMFFALIISGLIVVIVKLIFLSGD